jgi:hypothetical protein
MRRRNVLACCAALALGAGILSGCEPVDPSAPWIRGAVSDDTGDGPDEARYDFQAADGLAGTMEVALDKGSKGSGLEIRKFKVDILGDEIPGGVTGPTGVDLPEGTGEVGAAGPSVSFRARRNPVEERSLGRLRGLLEELDARRIEFGGCSDGADQCSQLQATGTAIEHILNRLIEKGLIVQCTPLDGADPAAADGPLCAAADYVAARSVKLNGGETDPRRKVAITSQSLPIDGE